MVDLTTDTLRLLGYDFCQYGARAPLSRVPEVVDKILSAETVRSKRDTIRGTLEEYSIGDTQRFWFEVADHLPAETRDLLRNEQRQRSQRVITPARRGAMDGREDTLEWILTSEFVFPRDVNRPLKPIRTGSR